MFIYSYNQSQEFSVSEELSLHPLRLDDVSPESPLTETLYLSPHEEKEVAIPLLEELDYSTAGRKKTFSFIK